MGVFQNNLMGAAAAASAGGNFYDHQITNSVRIPATSSTSSSNGRLTRTFSTVDSNVHFTLNFWIKRSAIGGTNPVTSDRPLTWFTPRNSTSGSVLMEFKFCSPTAGGTAGDSLMLVNTNSNAIVLSTDNLFRDTSAWYNIHIQGDLDNGTASEKLKFFINGTEASYNTDNRSSFTSFPGLTAGAWTIGDYYNYGYPIQCYFAQWAYVDGSTLAPTVFGESKNGVWIPKDLSSGITWGSAGHLLNFESSSDLGNDSSGNNNDWTTANVDAHDQMLDTPTFNSDSNGGNFCTMNPVNTGSNNTFSEGNLKVVSTSGGCSALGTMSLVTGHKWYFEGKVTGSGNNWIGIIEENGYTNSANTNSSIAGSAGFNTYLYGYNGSIYYGANSTATGATITTDDIIGVLVDLESATNTIQFYKNGAAQGSAFNLTGTGINYTPMSDRGSSTGNGFWFNFGQEGTFGTGSGGGNSDVNGYGDFYYDDGAAAKALCTGNLPIADAVDPAQTDDNYPQELFSPILYSGNDTTNNITGLGFQPDLMLFKIRNTASSGMWVDTNRGRTKAFYSINADAEQTIANITAIGTDGFSLDGTSDFKANFNGSGNTYVTWAWRANGGTTSTNSTGTVNATQQVDPSGGFSISSYAGTGSSMTVGHGLSAEPKLTIIKDRDASVNWIVYTKLIDGTLDYLFLNTSAAAGDSGFTGPNSTIWNFDGESSYSNTSGRNYIMYNFTNIEGYLKVGTYAGNGNTDGAFVYTGFRPSFVMTKMTDGSAEWTIFDNKRDTYNLSEHILQVDIHDAERTDLDEIDILSNGFKCRYNGGRTNQSSKNYIFLAFAKNPFKYATAR